MFKKLMIVSLFASFMLSPAIARERHHHHNNSGINGGAIFGAIVGGVLIGSMMNRHQPIQPDFYQEYYPQPVCRQFITTRWDNFNQQWRQFIMTRCY